MADIDRADWHYGGHSPAGLPPENGGTPIGMILAWAIARALGSARLKREAGDRLRQLSERTSTGRVLLFEALDEKLVDGLLTPRARAFARDCYESHAYLADYDSVRGGDVPTLYHVRNAGVRLVGNREYPRIADDYAHTFRILKSLRPDVFLAQHPDIFGLEEKRGQVGQAARTNPFVDPAGYRASVREGERLYREQLARERASQDPGPVERGTETPGSPSNSPLTSALLPTETPL